MQRKNPDQDTPIENNPKSITEPGSSIFDEDFDITKLDELFTHEELTNLDYQTLPPNQDYQNPPPAKKRRLDKNDSTEVVNLTDESQQPSNNPPIIIDITGNTHQQYQTPINPARINPIPSNPIINTTNRTNQSSLAIQSSTLFQPQVSVTNQVQQSGYITFTKLGTNSIPSSISLPASICKQTNLKFNEKCNTYDMITEILKPKGARIGENRLFIVFDKFDSQFYFTLLEKTFCEQDSPLTSPLRYFLLKNENKCLNVYDAKLRLDPRTVHPSYFASNNLDNIWNDIRNNKVACRFRIVNLVNARAKSISTSNPLDTQKTSQQNIATDSSFTSKENISSKEKQIINIAPATQNTNSDDKKESSVFDAYNSTTQVKYFVNWGDFIKQTICPTLYIFQNSYHIETIFEDETDVQIFLTNLKSNNIIQCLTNLHSAFSSSSYKVAAVIYHNSNFFTLFVNYNNHSLTLYLINSYHDISYSDILNNINKSELTSSAQIRSFDLTKCNPNESIPISMTLIHYFFSSTFTNFSAEKIKNLCTCDEIEKFKNQYKHFLPESASQLASSNSNRINPTPSNPITTTTSRTIQPYQATANTARTNPIPNNPITTTTDRTTQSYQATTNTARTNPTPSNPIFTATSTSNQFIANPLTFYPSHNAPINQAEQPVVITIKQCTVSLPSYACKTTENLKFKNGKKYTMVAEIKKPENIIIGDKRVFIVFDVDSKSFYFALFSNQFCQSKLLESPLNGYLYKNQGTGTNITDSCFRLNPTEVNLNYYNSNIQPNIWNDIKDNNIFTRYQLNYTLAWERSKKKTN